MRLRNQAEHFPAGEIREKRCLSSTVILGISFFGFHLCFPASEGATLCSLFSLGTGKLPLSWFSPSVPRSELWPLWVLVEEEPSASSNNLPARCPWAAGSRSLLQPPPLGWGTPSLGGMKCWKKPEEHKERLGALPGAGAGALSCASLRG